jgi:membrane peptidoglycan carboxypeptidase
VIKSVTDQDGKTREVTVKGRKVVSATVTRDATYAMQKVVDAGTGVNAALPDRNVAGKTGTTSDGKQIWFNGFIPQLTTSVGVFRSDNKPLTIPGYSAYGGDLPAKVWRSYMEQADQNLPVRSFGPPSTYPGGIGRATSVPVVPRQRPSPTRPGTRPSRPSHEPTRPPTDRPPLPPPTGRPSEGAPRGQSGEYRGTSG